MAGGRWPQLPLKPVASAPFASIYKAPEPLQAVGVLDLLELTGSSVQSAELLQLSQPTVSRRSRRLAEELGLELHRQAGPYGLRCGDGACLRLLRRAAKRHRLDTGVARIAADGWLHGALEHLDVVLPLPARFRSIRQWHALVRSHVLDGAVVCGQELRLQLPELPTPEEAGPDPEAWDGCLLVPLGSMPLSLVRARDQRHGRPGTPRWSGVLLPPMACCSGIAPWCGSASGEPCICAAVTTTRRHGPRACGVTRWKRWCQPAGGHGSKPRGWCWKPWRTPNRSRRSCGCWCTGGIGARGASCRIWPDGWAASSAGATRSQLTQQRHS